MEIPKRFGLESADILFHLLIRHCRPSASATSGQSAWFLESQLFPYKPLLDVDVVFLYVIPLETEDLARSHTGDDGEFRN